ncbi:MAG: ABC transporter ATP-binding protein [Lachnospiraceae bacterium]|nr:ABC transporter ATP-binding protein [Lachnospiraceae bacterium]
MIRELSHYIKQFKKATIATPICMVAEVIMEMFLPLLMAYIVDNGVYQGNMSAIFIVGLIMLVCSVLGLAAGIGGGYFGAKASTGFARNLRKAMFANIQEFSFAEIDKFSTSGLVTRLTTDVTMVQNSFQMLLRMAVRAPISLVVAMTMTFIINKRIALIYLFAVLILGVIVFFIIRRTTKFFRQMFERYDKLNESVEENLSGMRLVKAYNREAYENNRFVKAVQKLYDISVKAENNMIILMPVMTLTIYTCIILISWVGANMIVSATLTTGELMSLLTYCMNILMSLMMFAMVIVMMTMAVAAAQRIYEVLDQKTSLPEPENPIFEVKDGSIDFNDVDFSYRQGSRVADLKDVELHIKSGEVIGIIGGTGSAKTTLVNLISRLYDTTQGTVFVGGVDVTEYDRKTLRDAVAVVLQKNVLFSGTVLENLRWGNKDATEEECREVCRIACADEFVSKMPEGYNTHLEQGATNISGGQKQRLCIARALLKKPRILILDDSTSAVDTATEKKIREGMKTFIPGTTKIIISQRISAVEHADRVIVMDDGRVSGFDTPANLMENNAIYREVWEAQNAAGGDFDEKGGE